jgi:hypothetical protein
VATQPKVEPVHVPLLGRQPFQRFDLSLFVTLAHRRLHRWNREPPKQRIHFLDG